MGRQENRQGNEQSEGAASAQSAARAQARMEANRKTSTKVGRVIGMMQWFTREVWPNLFASIVWSVPTLLLLFWRFAKKFVQEREDILHRLDEMHRNMNEQHEGIQEEVHRAPPPPPRPRRSPR